MKTKLKLLSLLPFFTLLVFVSCQHEVIDISQPNENEAVTAESDLAKLMQSTSTLDGSKDDFLDASNCFNLKLPVVVHIGNFRNITINSEADFVTVNNILDQYSYTREQIEFNFPITVIMANYQEVVLDSREAFAGLINQCGGATQVEEHIRCIDFIYPVSFSVYNRDFQIFDVVAIENDREMFYFMSRIRASEVLARLNFPVNMTLADGTAIVVNSNLELKNTIQDAKEACVEQGIITVERIKNYLQECSWRVERLGVDGMNLENFYIGTPLKFFLNNIVNISVNGELVQGTYQVASNGSDFVLQIMLPNRPGLQLEWLVSVLEPGVIRLVNANNRMILERHCPEGDLDLNHVVDAIMQGQWEVTGYNVNGLNMSQIFFMYTLSFLESGEILVADSNYGVSSGSWLSYRKDGLNLGLQFGVKAPFSDLNHRWKITQYSLDRIELKDVNVFGGINRILVLENKSNIYIKPRT